MRRLLLFLLLASLAGCAALAYSRLFAASPQAEALAIAGDRPFCVQVPGKDDYRPAGMDLRPGPGMWGDGGLHHAVLVVGSARAPETYHWSYLKNRFVEGSYGPFPVVCTPARDYFRHAAQLPRGGRLAFTLAGRSLDISDAYQGEPLWPGATVGYRFQACAPRFEPAAASCPQSNTNHVTVAFRGDATPDGMAHRIREAIRAEPIAGGDEAPGLVRPPGLREYVELGGDGQVRTYIGCERRVWPDCEHVFVHEGLSYRFTHLQTELPQWRAMQQRLIDLHERFERRDAAGQAAGRVVRHAP